MKFVWYITQDWENVNKYRKKNFIVCPTEEEILIALRQGKTFNVISTSYPPKEFRQFFIVREIDGDIFTSQEKRYLELAEKKRGKDFKFKLENELLKAKTGLSLYYSNLSLKDLRGMDRINEFVNLVKQFDFGSPFFPKSVFLVGVPGTGKSFSLKTVAGELGYAISEISLVELLGTENPPKTLERILNFLESKEIPTIVWVDEVEKAFGEPKFHSLMQKLLTVLQEWNETKYFVKGFWWWTANDLKLVKDKYPEFLRSERHDYLWFVDYPKQSDARDIAKLYFEKFFLAPYGKIRVKDKKKYDKVYSQAKEKEEKILDDFLEFAEKQTVHYQTEGVLEAGRIPFTPAEIKGIIKLLAKWSFSEGDLVLKWNETLNYINPVIDIAKDKIRDMRSQRDIFKPLN
jgi:SpoVK/Ycf46/Vps4 family AAA+-type ATPase